MRVRLIGGRALADGRAQEPGQVVEVSQAEGLRMIAAWQAVAVEAPAERATDGRAAGAETAAAPNARTRRQP